MIRYIMQIFIVSISMKKRIYINIEFMLLWIKYIELNIGSILYKLQVEENVCNTWRHM